MPRYSKHFLISSVIVLLYTYSLYLSVDTFPLQLILLNSNSSKQLSGMQW